jgi:TetR/AcrR family transcriptional repressor of nem operon
MIAQKRSRGPSGAETADPSTRDRILRSAFQLFHEQGYHATGVATILREANVNPGSLYHAYPSKNALLLGVLEFALGYLRPAVMEPAEAAAGDPIGRVFELLRQYRTGMQKSGCKMGCPIGNLALEVSDDDAEARALIHENFENWASHVQKWLEDAGVRLPRSLDRARLARFVLTVMEGGLMQSRAAASLDPFDESVAVLRDYFDLLLARAGSEPQPKRRGARKPSRRSSRRSR